MTGAEGLGVAAKAWAWAKRSLLFARRIATLEARIAALEDALKKQPGDACPVLWRARYAHDQQEPASGRTRKAMVGGVLDL
jgi:hypothetical protein